jgi:hypothetical protein
VKPGSTLRTAIGVIAVDKIEPTQDSDITEQTAKQAGFPSRVELLNELSKRDEGQLYRIFLRLAGPDPRVELRLKSALSKTEALDIATRISQWGAKTPGGPWAIKTLRLIAERPAVRAANLAKTIGMAIHEFKPRVRQLKELGLTESLEVGYRLSPRGQALLRHLAEDRQSMRSGS